MLDEEKIRLMTRISIYEKEQEHDELVLSHYYREDYVRYGCLRTLVVATLTYWSVVAMYVLYRFQELLREINSMDYFDVIKKLMLGYMGFVAILYVFGFVVYHIRFQMAKKGLIEYNRNLKRYLRWEERNESRQEIEGGFVKISGEIGGDDPEIKAEESLDNKSENKSENNTENNTENNSEDQQENKTDDAAGAASETSSETGAEVKADEAAENAEAGPEAVVLPGNEIESEIESETESADDPAVEAEKALEEKALEEKTLEEITEVQTEEKAAEAEQILNPLDNMIKASETPDASAEEESKNE